MTTIPNPPQVGDEFTNDATGITYRYDGFKWYVLSGPVDADIVELTRRVDEGVEVQDNILATIDSALATQGELVNKVAQLEGVAIDARWTFEEDNRLPTRGEFALRGAGDAVISDWSAADVIIINPTDSLGSSYTFEKVTVDDVIRIGGPPGSSAEYKIIEIGIQGSFRVEHLISEGTAQDEFMYAFTFLSSFDPQGLATIDYVDNQDGLRVLKTGDTMTGSLTVSRGRNIEFQKEDGSNQFSIRPNINQADYFTNIYSYNGSGVRFRVATGQTTEAYDTILSITGETQDIGDTEYRGKAYLNRVRTPTQDDQAANKWYVDNALGDVNLDGYLPLTGGDMTGDINMMNCRLDTFNADGVQTMEIAPSGFIKTRDMLRVVRANGPILEGRQEEDPGSTTTKIWSDGTYEFYGPGRLYDDVNIYNNKRLVLRGTLNNNVGYIEATTNNQMTIAGFSGKSINVRNLNAPSAPTDAATKGYVDGLVAPFVTGDEVDSKINNETVHLPLTGGDLSGRVDITMPTSSSAAIRTIGSINVKADNQEIGGSNSFIAHKDYVRVFPTPSGPNDVVNKEFLDTQLANVAEPDLSGYLRKSEFYHYNRAPAVLSWKYNATTSGDSAPPDEYFKITDNGGDKYFRLSFKTSNGADLGDSAFSDTNVNIDNGPVGTVWYWNWQEERWRLKEQFRINTFRWNYNGHFEFRTSSRHGSKNYTVGTAYFITIGGFF